MYAVIPRSFGPEPSLSTTEGESESRSSRTLATTAQGMPAALDVAAIVCAEVTAAVLFNDSPSHFFAPDVVATFEMVTIVP